MICKYFPFSICLFTFMIMLFDTQKFFILITSNLLFLLLLMVFVISKNHCQIQGYKDSPLCFLENFMNVAFIFRSLITFWLIFVYGMRQGFNFIILHETTQLSQRRLFVEETILSSRNNLNTFVKTQLATDIWVYFWTSNSMPLICMYILLPSNSLFLLLQ